MTPIYSSSYPKRITWECRTCKAVNVSKWIQLPGFVYREHCQACNAPEQLSIKTVRHSYIHWYQYVLNGLELFYDSIGQYFYELATAFGYQCDCEESC
jgi:hypothetical protein